MLRDLSSSMDDTLHGYDIGNTSSQLNLRLAFLALAIDFVLHNRHVMANKKHRIGKMISTNLRQIAQNNNTSVVLRWWMQKRIDHIFGMYIVEE